MRGLHEESEDDEEEEDSRASSARTILGNMFAGSEEKGAKNTRSNPGIKLSTVVSLESDLYFPLEFLLKGPAFQGCHDKYKIFRSKPSSIL